MQRVLGAQYGEIPLSAQQKRRKQNDAWFGINFMIPRPERTSIVHSFFQYQLKYIKRVRT